MPLQVEGSRVQGLGPVVSSNIMGSMRRVRELADIAPHYVAKSGLCSASELESSKGGSIRIQHVTGLSSAVEGKSRFPKLDECAHFHYEHVEIGPLQVSIVDVDDLKPLSNGSEEEKWWSLSVTSQNKTWLIRRSYDNFRMLDQQLHRCIYDRKFSELMELPAECIEEQENLHKVLSDYVKRFSAIAGSLINCGPILNWLELDNRGHRLLVPDTDNCPINTPAVAAAYSVKRYTAQAPDEISFEVGDMISVIDMPPSEESIWWRGKRGFQVGFFPCECVAVIGDKVPRNLQFNPQLSQPTKPVLRKHGKLIAFFRSFILSRPSRRKLKQSGILKERVFGCDLGEHLLNSGHEIPMVLKCCVEFIESHGLVDGIYRLSGITSNIQKLRNTFDEDRVPALYEDEAILQDVHSVASLLKMYFRELPNPLCTYQLYHHFVGAVQATQGDDTRLLKMRDVVQKLPPPHYRTLEYLMRHLSRVSEKGHETGMTSRNVAIVWAPNLLRCKELEIGGVAALQGVGVQAVVTEFLVCYADLIFCDKLPNFNLPPQQMSTKKTRPKSLAISTPTKLLSLEEARNRALLQAAGKVEQDYIEVGGGPASLPAKYHTIIELPGSSRKRLGSKRSPIGWKLLFGKSGRSSQSRKDIGNKTSTASDLGIRTGKAVTELDLGQSRRRLRPAKSVESLSSTRNSGTLDFSDPPGGFTSLEDTLSPMLLRNVDGKNNGHNRSVSHESYFDQLQDQKEDVALDISEIQVNFDLEESEMRIFSEDETLMSAGSGSLASNSSPQILPIQKLRKGVTSVNKRLSNTKTVAGEDSFCTSQSADPSPKKQKINDAATPRSKLEEQLSSSVGDIQFIDSVSPDQVLVQAEVHPIQSPSPVSSISLISSSLLPPSSPILPHIPHLRRPLSQSLLNQNSIDSSVGPESNISGNWSGTKSNISLESVRRNRPLSTISNEISPHSYLTSPSLAEATISDNESFSLQSSELTTPETPMCRDYTPLVDFEEFNSNMTTPDFDVKGRKSSSETDNLDRDMTKANLEFDDCQNIGAEFAKFEEKVISGDVVANKPKYENITPESFKQNNLKAEESPPKPEERKPKPIHSYVNIPLRKMPEETGKVLETSFDFVENAENIESISNQNLVVNIKYEVMSTESSSDSLINMNKNEDTSLLLGSKYSDQSLPELKKSELTKTETPEFCRDANEKNSEMNLLKECRDWLQTKQEFLKDELRDQTIDLIAESGMKSEGDVELLVVMEERKISLDKTSTSDFSPEIQQEKKDFNVISDEELSVSEDLLKETNNLESIVEMCFSKAQEAEVLGNAIEESKSSPNFEHNFQKLEKKILETDLDEVVNFEIPISLNKTTEKPIPKKRTSPLKSNSSGNVRQLLSKFEMSPTTEKDLLDLKNDFERKKRKEEKQLQEITETKKIIEERPKTLERLSTKRRQEKSNNEFPQVQIEKSKSGSQINEKRIDGKLDILLNCDFDMSDPERRERIEKYKEKRRNYLREKYRSDSFKTDKDEFVLKIKPRTIKKEEVELFDRSSRTHLPSLSNEKKSPEKKSSDKSGRRSSIPKALDSPSKEPSRGCSSSESSGRMSYESPTVSSAIREQSNRRNNFLRFSSERKSACDFRSTKSSPEKKNFSTDFPFGGGSSRGEKLSPEFPGPFYSRRRMTDPVRSGKCVNPSSALQSPKSSCSVGASDRVLTGSASTPSFCIKDMTALFEKRDNSKTHKQYLSSV